MFDNIALDVAIGIIFVFLLYSLLASIIQEFLAKILGLRARMLLKAISRLLDDEANLDKKGIERISLLPDHYSHPFKDRPFTEAFYSHPSIKFLGKNEYSRKPAYISDALFAETVIKILRTDKFTGSQNQVEIVRNQLEGGSVLTLKTYGKTQQTAVTLGDETRANLLELVYDSGNDLEKLKARLEQWYNEMMARAEGWYTRQTRAILFVIGFILAVSFNIDSIAITKLLATNNTARSAMVQGAYAFKMPEVSTDSSDTALINRAKLLMKAQIDSANKVLGLGYNNAQIGNYICATSWVCIPGWLITALAISLGAPFWFDLLQKIMAVRQAGSKPAESANVGTPSKSQTEFPGNVKNRVG